MTKERALLMIRVFKSEYQDDKFYALMGRHFASLAIAKELEQQVYNKDNTTWFLRMNRNEVLGFVSVFDNGKYYFVDNLYVLPEARNRGIADELIAEIIELYTDKPIRCITYNPYALTIFKRYGFVEVGQNGKYKKLIKH